MPNRIEGSATRRDGDGQIVYDIEPDGHRHLNVKMTQNLDSNGHDAGAIFARDEPFHLHELIASLVEHGNLNVFFKGRSEPNVGFMSAVLDDIGFNSAWVEQTRTQLGLVDG